MRRTLFVRRSDKLLKPTKQMDFLSGRLHGVAALLVLSNVETLNLFFVCDPQADYHVDHLQYYERAYDREDYRHAHAQGLLYKQTRVPVEQASSVYRREEAYGECPPRASHSVDAEDVERGV